MAAHFNLAKLRRALRRKSVVEVVITMDPRAIDAGVHVTGDNIVRVEEQQEHLAVDMDIGPSTVGVAPNLWTLQSGLDLHGLPNDKHYTYRLLSGEGHFVEFRFDNDEDVDVEVPTTFRATSGHVSLQQVSKVGSLIDAKWHNTVDVIQKGAHGGTRAIFDNIERESEVYLLQDGGVLELDHDSQHNVAPCNNLSTIWARQHSSQDPTESAVAKLEQQQQDQQSDSPFFGLIVRAGKHSHGILINLTTKAIRVEKWAQEKDGWIRDRRSFSAGDIGQLPSDLVHGDRPAGFTQETEDGSWKVVEATTGRDAARQITGSTA